MRKKGIAVAGNMIVDMLYPIDGFPKPGELTTITADATRSTGGCLCNDILDLATLDPELPLTALGRVGEDEASDFVLEKLRERPNISLEQIRRQGTTSYTLVMADEVSKQRSFYQCRGANADFCEADIDWDRLDVDMLHIGYILLLDALDAPDGEYGTKMARLLHTARQRGIKTSIDVVTEASERFGRIVTPALRYTDYCVINEVEAQATTGVRLTREDGLLRREALPGSARHAQGTGRVHLGGHPLAGGRLWIGRKQRLRGSGQPEIAAGLHQGFRGRGRTPSAPACSTPPGRGCRLRRPSNWARPAPPARSASPAPPRACAPARRRCASTANCAPGHNCPPNGPPPLGGP